MTLGDPLNRSRMTVILASIDARPSVCASIEAWLRAIGNHGELIVVDASRDGSGDEVEARFPGVRLLRRPSGRLAPELWRDGLDASDTPLVAFSTTQMLPAEGWREAILNNLEMTKAAVAAGPIEPAPGLRPVDRAVYLLRYIHYLRPLNLAGIEPPGENAVYRRERLVGLETLWKAGFWESAIHRALRARGDRLAMSDGPVIAFQGGARLLPMLVQRYVHARHYGASRALWLGTMGRVARLAAAPAVPTLLLSRIINALTTRRRSLLPWFPALPYLLPLLMAWSLGEACGLVTHRPRSRRQIFGGTSDGTALKSTTKTETLGFRGSLLS